ncbi:alpha/beta hydrolase [Microvirga massiliensis]|uniref:alpha/beta hydrolase n=1 Tax=Microvirga massiliensis TaxID=1033741 RepID=UPI00062B58D1|nr:alpha/beta hydrolase [Microvirga massiliensis]
MPKDPLVLVPGLGCTAALFEPQIARLSPERSILVADHTRDESIAAIAERLLETAPERFALAGLSMGGYVALEVLRQAPARVARLALLDTSARPDTDEARANRRNLIQLAKQGHLDEIHAALWPRLVAPAHQADERLEEIVRRMLQETGPDAFIRQQTAIMGRADSRPFLPSTEIPTLVLVGAEDLITPQEIAREMAEAIEWASLVVVPGSGHLSSLEAPEAVGEALREWLSRG